MAGDTSAHQSSRSGTHRQPTLRESIPMHYSQSTSKKLKNVAHKEMWKTQEDQWWRKGGSNKTVLTVPGVMYSISTTAIRPVISASHPLEETGASQRKQNCMDEPSHRIKSIITATAPNQCHQSGLQCCQPTKCHGENA